MPRLLPSLLWFCATLALLGGCATQPLPQIDNWDSYQSQLAQVESWQLNGKLGVRLQSPDKPQKTGGSASIDWQQHPRDYAIRLSGPLGQGTTWIKGNANGVRLEQAGQPPMTAATPEQLVEQSLGWQLPISELFYWVRGIPAPRLPIDAQVKAPSGGLEQLQQSGWQLAFSRYNAVGPWQLPGKIVAERDGLRLILVINNWQL